MLKNSEILKIADIYTDGFYRIPVFENFSIFVKRFCTKGKIKIQGIDKQKSLWYHLSVLKRNQENKSDIQRFTLIKQKGTAVRTGHVYVAVYAVVVADGFVGKKDCAAKGTVVFMHCFFFLSLLS